MTADGTVRVDQGKCILCGWCVGGAALRVRVVGWRYGGPRAGSGNAGQALIVPEAPETGQAITAARTALAARTAALRRSVHIRHVDVGFG